VRRTPSVLHRSGWSQIGRPRKKRTRRCAATAAGHAAVRSRSVRGSAVAPTRRPAGGCQRRIHRAPDRYGVAAVPLLPASAEPSRAEVWVVAAGLLSGPESSAHRRVPAQGPMPVRPSQSGQRERAFRREVFAEGGQARAASLRQEVLRAWRRAWHRAYRRGWPRGRSSVLVPTS
jgi:hypothetical protein